MLQGAGTPLTGFPNAALADEFVGEGHVPASHKKMA
jgi:hypothetical protein